MALTPEQQAEIQIDIEKQKFRLEAEAAANLYDKENQRDVARRSYDLQNEARRNKMDFVRISKEVLVENDRNKPVGDRGVSATDIIAFAEELSAYVNK